MKPYFGWSPHELTLRVALMAYACLSGMMPIGAINEMKQTVHDKRLIPD